MFYIQGKCHTVLQVNPKRLNMNLNPQVFFWRKAECLNLIICFLLEYVHFAILNCRQILENSRV